MDGRGGGRERSADSHRRSAEFLGGRVPPPEATGPQVSVPHSLGRAPNGSWPHGF